MLVLKREVHTRNGYSNSGCFQISCGSALFTKSNDLNLPWTCDMINDMRRARRPTSADKNVKDVMLGLDIWRYCFVLEQPPYLVRVKIEGPRIRMSKNKCLGFLLCRRICTSSAHVYGSEGKNLVKIDCPDMLASTLVFGKLGLCQKIWPVKSTSFPPGRLTLFQQITFCL